MKTILLFLFSALIIQSSAQFNDFFYPKTLRIDYFHAGNNRTDTYYLDEVKIEPFWGGSPTNLIDTFGYGQYYTRVFDLSTEIEIYSRGFSTLFGEWQTTEEASKTQKSFSETVTIPLPKNDARIEFYTRNKKGILEKKFEYIYNTDDYFVTPERKNVYPVSNVHISGDPSQKVDIVILPDGYTANEMEKFNRDCKAFTDAFFQFEPYKQNIDKFNIKGVLAPSEESGNDIPADSVWKNTILGTSFYTFDSERYCMTRENKMIRDLASNAPYDQIYILVNSDKYGGGGIYNQYCVSVSGNLSSAKIIVHEFGHGFAGLGDEYHGSKEAYNEFYPLDVEPWEPNLTTLVNFDIKWKDLMEPDIPVPTPELIIYRDMIGVFEGGGYVGKGVYRPAYDCLMNTFNGDRFCAVCVQAIEDMIEFYTE